MTVGGVGSKIGGRRQVATAGWGTSARGSPKQMGGAVPTYNFHWNGLWRLRQQRQSCGGGPPALSCFACSMRRISARETKVLSPLQPTTARALRPPPGHTPAQRAEVLVPSAQKAKAARPLAFRPPLGSPTTPPNSDQPIVHSPSQPETLTHQHCDPLKRFAPPLFLPTAPLLGFWNALYHFSFFLASLHKTILTSSCLASRRRRPQRNDGVEEAAAPPTSVTRPAAAYVTASCWFSADDSGSVEFRSPLPVKR